MFGIGRKVINMMVDNNVKIRIHFVGGEFIDLSFLKEHWIKARREMMHAKLDCITYFPQVGTIINWNNISYIEEPIGFEEEK